MPIYEYECGECKERHEVIQKISDPPLDICPRCGGKMKKLFSSPAIQFKGSGFYKTDYAKSSGPSPSAEAKGGNGAEKSTSLSQGISQGMSQGTSQGTSESKSDTKAESKSDSSGEKKSAGKSAD